MVKQLEQPVEMVIGGSSPGERFFRGRRLSTRVPLGVLLLVLAVGFDATGLFRGEHS